MSDKFILHNLQSYNKPTSNDTCIGLCYFNAIGYNNVKENVNIVLDTYKKSGIPYFTIELIYPDQKPYLKKSTKVVHANTIMFSKENLWNLLEKSIPSKYKKIIFVDADIKFSNPDWFNMASKKLDDYDIIQPMDVVFRDLKNKKQDFVEISPESCNYSVAYMIETTNRANAMSDHPGYAVGIKRDIFKKINGFFEYGFYGCGDTLFWMAISNFYSSSVGDFLHTRKDIGKKFYEYKTNIMDYDIKIGSVFDNMSVHLFHGTVKNRNYADRSKYLVQSSRANNFFYNDDGVLEMTDDNSIHKYFLSRIEDNDDE
jgi:hypothetical protein